MPEWSDTPLGDLAEWYSGGTPNTSIEEYWGGDIPWISASSLRSFNITSSDRCVTTLGAANGTRLVPAGTTIFVVRGMSLMTEFRIGITHREVAFGQDCKALVPKADIDPYFLAYAIRAQTPVILGMVDAAGHGTGRLQTDRISGLRIPLPPDLTSQKATVALLKALDDKIAVNDWIVREADELRTLMFRRWEQSNPGMVENCPLSSFASFINGRAFTKDATGTGRMVIRIAEINSGPGGSTVYNDIDVPDVHAARPGDILFAWSGSLAISRWYRPEAIVNQHIFKVIPNAGIPAWLVFELVEAKLADFKGIAAGKATTMGHIQRHHLDEPVLAPKQECIAALDSELGSLWERALAAEKESLVLAELRDTLLPKLMSGEIRVREAKRVFEDAT
jgi:type I restriction enzyme S subunit